MTRARATARAKRTAAIEFEPVRPLALKERVIRQLTQLIDDGVLKPGDQLPSERELSDELRVSRGTVREAVQFLQALGLLEEDVDEIGVLGGAVGQAVPIRLADLAQRLARQPLVELPAQVLEVLGGDLAGGLDLEADLDPLARRLVAAPEREVREPPARRGVVLVDRIRLDPAQRPAWAANAERCRQNAVQSGGMPAFHACQKARRLSAAAGGTFST